MKYQVNQTAEGVRVTATVAGAQQAALLDEFAKCAAGTCSCPSTQYAKLSAIDVTQTDDGVRVDLTAKAGETIDGEDIQRCLDDTARRLGG